MYITVILPVVLYGCETWSLTLREEHRLRVFENSVEEDNIKMDLRKIGIDGVNWIWLARGRVQWRTFVNTVMNLGFHKESRIFFDKLGDSQLFK
jgi:hypothetical protein